MRVTIDDHALACPILSRAAATASLMKEARIGSFEKAIPSGRTASLTAPDIAAGAPR
jgi:hypothetical protein